MRKQLLMVFMLIGILTCSPTVFAEETGIRLTYDIDMDAGTIHVNMDNPVIPTVMYQYKVKPVTMDMKAVKKIILAHAQQPKKGDRWAFSNNSGREDGSAFVYEEVEGRYVLNSMEYFGPKRNDDTDLTNQATELVLSILDELGIENTERPVYAAFSQIKADETSMAEINTVQDYKHSVEGRSSIEWAEEHQRLEEDTTVVAARFLLDGIPMSIMYTCPETIKNGVDTEPASGCTFVINKNLEIVRALVLNYIEVSKKQEDTRPILGWEECLRAATYKLPIAGAIPVSMTLIQAELNYAIHNNGVTYPVWRYVFELDYRNEQQTLEDEECISAYTIGSWCVDAYTGNPAF